MKNFFDDFGNKTVTGNNLVNEFITKLLIQGISASDIGISAKKVDQVILPLVESNFLKIFWMSLA